MKNKKKNEKEINELVKLYFEYNPNMNRGIAFKAKANDIITSYMNTHNKTYEEIKNCIESNPLSEKPIWEVFYNYFSNKNKNKDKSNYKSSINDSTNADDWL